LGGPKVDFTSSHYDWEDRYGPSGYNLMDRNGSRFNSCFEIFSRYQCSMYKIFLEEWRPHL